MGGEGDGGWKMANVFHQKVIKKNFPLETYLTPAQLISFLAATGQFYRRVCLSVCQSVTLSVGLLVGRSHLVFIGFKLQYLSCLWSYWAGLWI